MHAAGCIPRCRTQARLVDIALHDHRGHAAAPTPATLTLPAPPPVACAGPCVRACVLCAPQPIVFTFGSRPFTGGMCRGTEIALADMRAGGRRLVVVPPELGFGPEGNVLRSTRHVGDKQGVIPPNATLEYELELVRVSIPPS